ncbi:MAG: 4-hydroxy-tetrahydrodipicolinate synthase [Candidatus Latescibacteria bacterium]|nr:4-hydroxy-tetrahydrodipicolinate synthase [Candidatus Latescibacterota bacterium]
MKYDLKGVITPVVTVFDSEENVDEKGCRTIINHLIDHGVHGIFSCGGQGEAHSLTQDEKLRLYDLCVETINGRVPALLGTAALTTRQAIDLTRAAKKAGADYATILTPYYISPSQDELYKHYCDIMDAVDIPVLIYNNPWRTHQNIAPETVARLCEYSPNMAGMKDSSGDLSLTFKYKKLCPDYFRVFVGRDQLIYAALCGGVDGAVAATSNAAIDIVLGIYNEFVRGNHEEARVFQDRLVPLREFFSQGTFPVIVKEALMLMGLPSGPCRRPVGPISEEKRKQLREVLKTMSLM